VISLTGSVRELPATGPAIGWTTDVSFSEESIPLAAGDFLLAYTDGISETTDASGAELGAAGLARLAAAFGTRTAAAIVTGILDGVQELAGGAPAADDRTLAVGKVQRR
jgi:sigma-B regulation protein RsbU (phosphoserine phosphatase)